jgi:hypothetical protein
MTTSHNSHESSCHSLERAEIDEKIAEMEAEKARLEEERREEEEYQQQLEERAKRRAEAKRVIIPARFDMLLLRRRTSFTKCYMIVILNSCSKNKQLPQQRPNVHLKPNRQLKRKRMKKK